MIKIYLIVFFSIATSGLLLANENIKNYYVGASVDYQRIYNNNPKFTEVSQNQDNLGGLSLVLGYKNLFASYLEKRDFSLDIEGRVTKSFWDESFAESLGYSLFLKPQYHLYKDINIYGLLGLGQLTIEGYNGEVPAHKNMIGQEIYSDVSFQWGVGISADISENISLFMDYTSLINDADIDSTLYADDATVYQELTSDTLNIGVIYKFNLEDLKFD